MEAVIPEVVCAGVCLREKNGGTEEEGGGRCVGGDVGWEVMRACGSGGGIIIRGCGGPGVWWWGWWWWGWWGLNSGKLARSGWWVRLLCRGGW
jgi:hypothetical protein